MRFREYLTLIEQSLRDRPEFGTAAYMQRSLRRHANNFPMGYFVRALYTKGWLSPSDPEAAVGDLSPEQRIIEKQSPHERDYGPFPNVTHALEKMNAVLQGLPKPLRVQLRLRGNNPVSRIVAVWKAGATGIEWADDHARYAGYVNPGNTQVRIPAVSPEDFAGPTDKTLLRKTG